MMNRRSFSETGQAALVIVLAIGVMLAVAVGVIETTVVRHAAFVQSDVTQHYAYTALDAGVNTYLRTVNADPDEIICSSASPTTGQCGKYRYGTWHKVTESTGRPGTVPEWYEWGNPTFCFTVACTETSSTTKAVLYVKEPVYGVAGHTGHYVYQTSTLDLKPENGFLTHIWWSNYESADPSSQSGTTSACTHGVRTVPPGCTPVFFGRITRVYGPIFTNDALYVTTSLVPGRLGPIETADPTCVAVAPIPTNTPSHPYNSGTCVSNATSITGTADKRGVPSKPIPTSDSQLLAVASEPQTGGCVYTGPTTITFELTDKMKVWSPETALTSRCKPFAKGSSDITVPNGTHGDGVIYVKNQPTSSKCSSNANPFVNGGTDAQWATRPTYHWSHYLGATSDPNCEGDAFVSDAPTVTTGAITGQIMVAAQNDIVITGNLEYTKSNCGFTFNSTKTHPCHFNVGNVNNDDVLGLVATNYVEVNHPVTHTGTSVLAPCPSTTLGTPTAATCNPVTPGTRSQLTIDAAIIALNNSFAVNNWKIGRHEGTLCVYGSIYQDWRGVVGTVTGIGYIKDYDWDNRLPTISPPYYLQPGTPSWGLASSSVNISTAPPSDVTQPIPSTSRP